MNTWAKSLGFAEKRLEKLSFTQTCEGTYWLYAFITQASPHYLHPWFRSIVLGAMPWMFMREFLLNTLSSKYVQMRWIIFEHLMPLKSCKHVRGMLCGISYAQTSVYAHIDHIETKGGVSRGVKLWRKVSQQRVRSQGLLSLPIGWLCSCSSQVCFGFDLTFSSQLRTENIGTPEQLTRWLGKGHRVQTTSPLHERAIQLFEQFRQIEWCSQQQFGVQGTVGWSPWWAMGPAGQDHCDAFVSW